MFNKRAVQEKNNEWNREANIRDSICYVDVDVKSKLDDEDLTMRWTGNQALYKVHEYCAMQSNH
jgi:hypothetical protein